MANAASPPSAAMRNAAYWVNTETLPIWVDPDQPDKPCLSCTQTANGVIKRARREACYDVVRFMAVVYMCIVIVTGVIILEDATFVSESANRTFVVCLTFQSITQGDFATVAMNFVTITAFIFSFSKHPRWGIYKLAYRKHMALAFYKCYKIRRVLAELERRYPEEDEDEDEDTDSTDTASED